MSTDLLQVARFGLYKSNDFLTHNSMWITKYIFHYLSPTILLASSKTCLSPFLTARQTRWHIDATRQATEELSMPLTNTQVQFTKRQIKSRPTVEKLSSHKNLYQLDIDKIAMQAEFILCHWPNQCISVRHTFSSILL